MITYICEALLDTDLVAKEDKHIFAFLKTLSKDIYGHCLNIAYEHPFMGLPRVATTRIDDVDSHPTVYFRIRYPVGITPSKIEKNINKAADKSPYTLSGGTYAHRLPNAYVLTSPLKTSLRGVVALTALTSFPVSSEAGYADLRTGSAGAE